MKKGFLVFAVSLLLSVSASGFNLTSMNFYQAGESSILELELDNENVIANKFQNSDDKQIVLDLKNVSASKRVLRAFDTSEFSGSIVYVTAYPKAGAPEDLRVVISLRENVRSSVVKEGSKIRLEIENRFGAFSHDKVTRSETVLDMIKNNKEEGRVHIPKSASLEDILENLTMSGRKKYIGKRVSFDLRDLSVVDILKMIAEASGFNIILADDLQKLPPMTLTLNNIAWDQALDTILELNELVATKNGVILTITTLAKATEKRRAEVEAAKMVEIQEPLVTKIFPISYGALTDMEKILEGYLTPSRGKIAKDERTNSFIIKDTQGVIEKLKKIVEVLDTQTPQILIESKIIEVNETYAKNLGLVDGIGTPVAATTAGAPAGATAAAPASSSPTFTFSSAPTAARNLFGMTISSLGNIAGLDFRLQMMESESKGKIISAPKVLAENKKKASITSAETTTYAVVERDATTGTATTTYKDISANLSLNVTPQVTNEGSILLDVDLTKEGFPGSSSAVGAPPDKNSRTIKTNVLVDNGNTVVIGGIYSYNKKENHSGVPVLKDIPLIGWLFRTAYNPSTTKNEMMIFLTPRIVNQEEAGLVSKNEI